MMLHLLVAALSASAQQIVWSDHPAAAPFVSPQSLINPGFNAWRP
jgi:hypothetical protein